MGKTRNPKFELSLIQLVPNMMTIAAICLGITAIKHGFESKFQSAVQLILLASVLDGLDGSVARLLKSDSKMGAELDSLADVLNFGVAPPLVLYFWALQDMQGIGWFSVQIFVVCCVVRLARFNVSSKSDEEVNSSGYFIGVPAPVAALLVMLPMYFSFAFDDVNLLPSLAICGHLALIGLLMISNIPTWSFKVVTTSPKNSKYFLIGFAIIGAAVLNYVWITLISLCIGYIILVISAIITGKTQRHRQLKSNS